MVHLGYQFVFVKDKNLFINHKLTVALKLKNNQHY